eukprot:TRINITY_DN314_c0_g4_i1.p1 TRINITY_DN314_c0_g4~~TRINITY_DN314_c0_g4_i1.p1  ORF type:complete len:364 (-),score=166.79 TRINITY_DN314_c0_g4_i1:29-1120(-)
MEKESVLVVGGCGFLGRYIVEQLLERHPNIHVKVFDLNLNNFDKRVEFIQGNLCSLEDVTNACKGVHSVFHTASPVHGRGKKVYFEVNVRGTRTLLESCEIVGVKQLIFTSTASVVFDGSDVRNGDETMNYCKKHLDPYNETKAIAEQEVLAADYSRTNTKLQTCAIRPAGIFGPRDRQAWPGFIAAAREGKSKVKLGDGQNLFDWTYVGNVAYAHVLAYEKMKDPTNKIHGEAFFISNGEPIPFWDMANYVWGELGYQTTCYSIPRWLILLLAFIVDIIVWIISPIKHIEPTLSYFRVVNATANRYFNISKAKRLLGYEPQISLADAQLLTLISFWDQRNPTAPVIPIPKLPKRLKNKNKNI